MSYETTAPAGAKDLLDSGAGWIYLDVRTEEEYASGHVPGAYNIPVATRDPAAGMTLNPAFTELVQRHFGVETKLVLGCAAGGRSARACEMLAPLGYKSLVNMHGGFSGAGGPSGEIEEPGWAACGFPVERECPAERAYSTLRG